MDHTPCTDIERELTAIWAELLGVTQIDREQDFFGAGGDSLLATKAVLWVRKTWKVDMTVQLMIEYPVLRDLARQIDALIAVRNADLGMEGSGR